MPDLAYNKIAKRDYELKDIYEAGLVLTGQEVKSIRSGQMKLQGSYITVVRGEIWLIGAHIPKWKAAGMLKDFDPDRSRKLLLHKREISHLFGKSSEKGLTIVPIRVYNKKNLIKLEFGIGRGRKEYEKREIKKKRDVERDIRERMKREM